MTQLELPPISFARYLELLKRRRWQVIPMSLAGLLIGAVVAFLIPRYYVARTSVTYFGRAVDTADLRDDKDPLQVAMNNANLDIPLMVPDALAATGVVGMDVDPDVALGLVHSYKFRTSVRIDTPRTGNSVGPTTVYIEFKDVDGQHSADFVNALRETWIEDNRSRLQEKAAEEVRKAKERVAAAQEAWDLKQADLRGYLRTHDIEPFDPDAKNSERVWLQERRTTLEGVIGDSKRMIAQLEARIEENNREIDALPETIEQRKKVEYDPVVQAEVARLAKELEYAKNSAKNAGPGNPGYNFHLRQVAQLEEQLKELVPGLDPAAGSVETVPHPIAETLREELRLLRKSLAAEQSTLAEAERELALLRQRVVDQAEAYTGFVQRNAELERLEAELKGAKEFAGQLETKYDRARFGDLFRIARADVPPTPTDPNIVVVALVGAVLGLGAAIGLVLLLDVLRSNFKTVDDVEYALRLPVLGTMSHLETDEERVEIVRHRRRIAIAAATFLVLSLSVVAVYYVDPNRLPIVVYDTLHMILGPGQ